MAKRRANHRKVKIHRSYTVEEIACLLSIHKNTVREWVKAGLPTCDQKRPMLILGRELAVFLQKRRAKNKQHCQPGEIYCVGCHAPKSPAGDMADFLPITETLGTLKAICPDCYSMINRHVSIAKLSQVYGKLNVTFSEAQRRLNESTPRTVNSDLR